MCWRRLYFNIAGEFEGHRGHVIGWFELGEFVVCVDAALSLT